MFGQTIIVVSCLALAAAIPGVFDDGTRLGANGNLPLPPVPRMLDSQKAAMESLTTAAKLASTSATPELLKILDSDVLRSKLRACCAKSGVDEWSPQKLLETLRANVYSAELVHNFDGSFSADATIEIGLYNATEYFPSIWQLINRGYYGSPHNVSWGLTQSPADSAEEGVFQLPSFTGAYDTPATYMEASSRLMYVALNTLRVDTGNPMFGNVTAVFSPSYWKDAVAVAGVDTGLYEMGCNETFINMTKHSHFPKGLLECTAGFPGVGVLGSMDHAILNNHRLWGTRVDAIGTLFARWYGANESYTNTTGSIWYMEADILANVLYEDRGVKLLVGAFGPLFGTPRGVLLQNWAKRHGIALAWGLGDGKVASNHHGHGKEETFVGGARILDLTVASSSTVHLNATITHTDSQVFQTLWDEVGGARSASGALSQSKVWNLWAKSEKALPPAVRVRVPAPHDCSDWEACLGANVEGECVCYSPSTRAVVV